MLRSRLISERKARKWTQKFVADQLGISVRAYQHYERADREPSLSSANRLEDLFGIPQRELLVRDCSTESGRESALEFNSGWRRRPVPITKGFTD